MSDCRERPLIMNCDGDRMVGVLHERANVGARPGVLIIVGGPQYRVGSHRQFLLMARAIAHGGYPVLRFDYRGMGDSEGTYRGFEQIQRDIRVAIDAFQTAVPTMVGVVLWGLCDGASAALMYGPSDERVAGLTIVNAWARTATGEAKAYVQHYYGKRLLQFSFWRKLLGGQLHVLRSVREFIGALRLARSSATQQTDANGPVGFIDRMRTGFESFARPVLLLESGRDLTAAEFTALRSDDPRWRRAVSRDGVTVVPLADADHTLSDRTQFNAALEQSLRWLATLVPAPPGSPGTRHPEQRPCR